MIQYTSEYGGRIGWGLSGKTTGEVKPFFCRTGTTKLSYYTTTIPYRHSRAKLQAESPIRQQLRRILKNRQELR